MRFSHNLIFAGVTLAVTLASCNDAPKKASGEASFFDKSLSDDQRIEAALSQMTLDEKIAMIHAQSKFSSPGVPRLGIPDIWTDDGPHGIRPDVFWDQWENAGCTNDSSTAFPALTCLAATWDPSLSHLYGNSIGEEARFRKKNVLLGPGVNICRTPANGRNFEYMGEDPYLASKMVVGYVQGVQEKGVAACVKHFALNNQELHRHTTDVSVDDRTLNEIYFPAFKAAVQEGGAWAIMGAYNLWKGQHACHNQWLFNDILKKDWGFDGVVISDWGGTHDTDQAIHNGLDMEFGSWTNGLTSGASNAYDNYYLAQPYKSRILAGKVGTEELDDKVRRILRLELRTNLDTDKGFGRFTCPDHYAAARKIGAEGIVLLKNDGALLPLKDAKKILVVGENAVKKLTVGGGSSSLKVQHEISPLQGIQERFGSSAEVTWCRGYVGSASNNYNGVSTGQDLSDDRPAEVILAEAVEAAKAADVVVFIGGLNKDPHQDCEDSDRLQYELPYGQGAVIEALAAANPKLVVVSISGTPVGMSWADKVPAIIQDWYLGSEAGRSLADVLSGDVNPSGKLPFSFPVNLEDGPIRTAEQYPGIYDEATKTWKETYSEGVFVGYRWYEAKEIAPRFAFGHGLSYTDFGYSDLKLSASTLKGNGKVKASLTVKNTGDVDGAEVVQLYVSALDPQVSRPVKELKGFQKVFLKAGESAKVEFEVDADDLSWYDMDSNGWRADAGSYMLLAGSASDDIRAEATFSYKK